MIDIFENEAKNLKVTTKGIVITGTKLLENPK